MHRSKTAGHMRGRARVAVGFALATLLLACGAEGIASSNPDSDRDGDGEAASFSELAGQYGQIIGGRALAWYRQTPPGDRITWGGLAACAGLGLGVVLERLVRLRTGRVVPRDFVVRYSDRLREGKLDPIKALDFCELNPSPAARVALAAVRRWGRPVADLERAVALAQRVEADQLRRHVGTLRRIAALAPLLGLLGSLLALGRVLAELNHATASGAWGPALAQALTPATVGVALAILALVAYDGLTGRLEMLAGTLDRLGAETIDAIAMATPSESRAGEVKAHSGGTLRAPHPIRVEIPDALVRSRNRDEDFD
jgi:biopolymer transport protein ExbB